MTDSQLHVRMVNKRMIIVAVLFILISCGLLYYCFSTQPEVDAYNAQIRQESNLRSQVQSLESANAGLLATIEQTGKELVSFSEDKIKYINLASSLSEEYNVNIDKLTVSDVWQEGQMAGMTTSIQVQGNLSSICSFINEYCSTRYTNRINVVSFRPVDRYPWIMRNLDDEKVIGWFDLSAEENLYTDKLRAEVEELQKAAAEAGIPASKVGLDVSPNAGNSELENAANLSNLSTGIPNPADSEETQQTPQSNFGDSGTVQASVTSNAPPPDDGTGVPEPPEVSGENGANLGSTISSPHSSNYTNPYSGESQYIINEKEPITLSTMFMAKTFKIYLEIDFLGRQ